VEDRHTSIGLSNMTHRQRQNLSWATSIRRYC